MVSLYNAFRAGSLTLSEYQSYLDLGYDPSDPVQLTSGRSAEMVTVSYMNLGSGRTWTVKSGETIMGYIGPNADLINSGEMVVDGDALFLYNSGKISGTGNISGSGHFLLYPLKSTDL